MSCKKCNEAQDRGSIAYLRWGTANVGFLGCNNHLKEIFQILRENGNLADRIITDTRPIYKIKND